MPDIKVSPTVRDASDEAAVKRESAAAGPAAQDRAPASSSAQPRARVRVVGQTDAMATLRRLRAETKATLQNPQALARHASPAPSGTKHPREAAAGALPSNGATTSPRASDGSVVPGEREAGLLALLKLEAEARSVRDIAELSVLVANEARRLVRARQIFVLRRERERLRLVAVTALPTVDRMAPLTQTIEAVVAHLESEGHAGKPSEFRLSAYAEASDDTARSYPLQEAAWVPYRDRDGAVFAGMLLTREAHWLERDMVIAARLGATFAHAWNALEPRPAFVRSWRPSRRATLLVTAVLLALAFVPVSLTTLAPVEIVPRDPYVIAAPIDGVVEDIPIEPNSRVAEDTVLVKFEDTTLRNRLEVAEREVHVAAARLKTTTQIAFADESGRHELAVARAELQLKTAERDFARDLLAKAEIRAPRSGLAVLGDKKELIGRPLSVGERILEIADPSLVEARIEVPVADSIILKPGARVKLLLDANPLGSIGAVVVSSNFQARMSDASVLSFRVIAAIDQDIGAGATPRLGARGTAQIYGERVALGFYLLRRPFAKLRQWTGL